MIKRTILKKLIAEQRQPEVNILLGPRQVGKTTLLKQLERYASKSKQKTAFFDLEQPQVLADFNTPNHKIIEKLGSSGDIVFIDEFQYIQNASR
ncbi:AAA family ATPase, partial [Candidatus Omnitrophota bacterium]